MNKKTAVGIAMFATLAPCAGEALAASAPQPRTETLRFYQVVQSTRFYNAAGKEIKVNPPKTLPAASDWVDEIDDDYPDSFLHHAKRWTSTDQLLCTFTNSRNGECYVQLAIDGSLLAVNHIPAATTGTGPEKISVATGAFSGANGTLTATQLKNGNSDLVINISRAPASVTAEQRSRL
jgi:hypothetical protein